MKGKNVVILGVGVTIGFVSRGVIMTKRILLPDVMGEILFGEALANNRRNSKVSYSSYYEPRKCYEFDSEDVVFESRKKADAVLNDMKKIIEQYGVVSMADFYELCEIRNVIYDSSRYGWTNADWCEPTRTRSGYILKLPKPIRLD